MREPIRVVELPLGEGEKIIKVAGYEMTLDIDGEEELRCIEAKIRIEKERIRIECY